MYIFLFFFTMDTEAWRISEGQAEVEVNLFLSVHPLHCGRGGDDQCVKTTSECNLWRAELHSPGLPSSLMHTYISIQTYQNIKNQINPHTSTWLLCTKQTHVQSGANSQRIDGGL